MSKIWVVPTIYVANIENSITYYQNVFGHTLDFKWGNPVFYAGMKLGDSAIHLNAAESTSDRRGKGGIYYVIPGDIYELYERIIRNGGTLVGNPPQKYDYGMIDFKCVDPDGNWISFGKDAV